MPTTNSTVYNAYGKKKRNSLAPYLDAGNNSTSGDMQLANTQPTGGNTRLYNAYAGAGTQPKAMTKVARAYSAPATPTDTAYRSATSPTAANSAQYQPGEILRQSAANGNANNAQPQSALAATPAATAQAGAQAQSALTGTPSATPATTPATTAPSTGNTAQQRPTVYDLYGSQNNSGAYSAGRQNALNQAEASYNKFLNYLPEYNELMGMRGLGVSEQALLNAQNNYMQNVADINAQYDEMEQVYRDTRISNINTLSADLSNYITSAGDNFTQEGYDRFKQGLLQAGYTEQELAAAESLLLQSDWAIIDNYNANKNNMQSATPASDSIKKMYGVEGNGILAATANEEDFGKYFDTGKEGTNQYNLVRDILKAAKEGRIPNGTYVNFNFGAGNATFYVYYNGYFYPTQYGTGNYPDGVSGKDVIGGAGFWGNHDYINPNDL